MINMTVRKWKLEGGGYNYLTGSAGVLILYLCSMNWPTVITSQFFAML